MDLAQLMKVDITEEMKSELLNFLESNPWQELNPKMAVLYGRLKAQWIIIEKAEEWLKPCYEKKREIYKWKILNEIKQWLEDIRNENPRWWHYQYEIANIKQLEEWRAMQIWFQDTNINDKTIRLHSVVIEERKNPEFFEEMLKKYSPDLSYTNNNQRTTPF